jgi:hypothetical protein
LFYFHQIIEWEVKSNQGEECKLQKKATLSFADALSGSALKIALLFHLDGTRLWFSMDDKIFRCHISGGKLKLEKMFTHTTLIRSAMPMEKDGNVKFWVGDHTGDILIMDENLEKISSCSLGSAVGSIGMIENEVCSIFLDSKL